MTQESPISPPNCDATATAAHTGTCATRSSVCHRTRAAASAPLLLFLRRYEPQVDIAAVAITRRPLRDIHGACRMSAPCAGACPLLPRLLIRPPFFDRQHAANSR